MALKEKVWVSPYGRDKGITFHIKEMTCFKAEFWAFRVLRKLINHDAGVLQSNEREGVIGMLKIGLLAFSYLTPEDAKELMDEMLTCVKVIPDKKTNFKRDLIEEDIQEVVTLISLRSEIIKLHTDFFTEAAKKEDAA